MLLATAAAVATTPTARGVHTIIILPRGGFRRSGARAARCSAIVEVTCAVGRARITVTSLVAWLARAPYRRWISMIHATGRLRLMRIMGRAGRWLLPLDRVQRTRDGTALARMPMRILLSRVGLTSAGGALASTMRGEPWQAITKVMWTVRQDRIPRGMPSVRRCPDSRSLPMPAHRRRDLPRMRTQREGATIATI